MLNHEQDGQKNDGVQEHIRFDCVFTSSIRRTLRRKRTSLGLTYTLLAEFFGVNWSTVRKWEQGPTQECELVHRPKLEGFLNGEFDLELLSWVSPRHTGRFFNAEADADIRTCLERLSNTYGLCSENKEIAQRLITELEAVAKKILFELVSTQARDEDERLQKHEARKQESVANEHALCDESEEYCEPADQDNLADAPENREDDPEEQA